MISFMLTFFCCKARKNTPINCLSVVSNSKPNLVFLHGWGGSWQSWYPILESLKTDYNLYALDLPGSVPNPISKPYYLSNFASYVNNYLKKNKVKNPILIGHSP